MFWNQLFQTCSFLEKIHGMCKHCPLVIFHIFLQNVYNLFEQCKIFLSIFAFAHHHAAHSFVLSICFSHFNPHVLIFSNYLRGFSRVGSFEYSKGVFIISHILFSMFEIKVYLIIVSKVFGVTIAVNFLFTIVK